MTLHVVLRTCDSAVVHHDWRKRYCNMPKNQLLLGCLRSLCRSLQSIENYKITVLDDYSTESTVEQIQQILHDFGINHEFISLEHKGYNYSELRQFEICRDTDASVIYCVEDDYLHCDTAIKEMLFSLQLFVGKLNKPILLYPFDAPEVYNPPREQCFVVHGSHRHWRTGAFCSGTFMTTPKFIRTFWPAFEMLATKYNGDYLNPRSEHVDETNTIWQIWQQGQAVRLNPIPSLALHMQFKEHEDPMVNWQKWWNLYAQSST